MIQRWVHLGVVRPAVGPQIDTDLECDQYGDHGLGRTDASDRNATRDDRHVKKDDGLTHQALHGRTRVLQAVQIVLYERHAVTADQKHWSAASTASQRLARG